MLRIPKILHYCFGMAVDFGGKPWSLIHHACVKSAIQHIRPDAVRFYYHYEPEGPWWDATRPLVDAIRIDLPTRTNGERPEHYATCADLVRLDQLIAHGGIYLDADVLVRRSFDPLLNASAVVGVENFGDNAGLGNSVVLGEPGAPFLRRWHAALRGSSVGLNSSPPRSMRLPTRLATQHRNEVQVLPFTAFNWPLWEPNHIALVFDSTDPVGADSAFARHLWESNSWDRVAGLTPGMVRERETNFCHWVRPYVADLPDDYGASDIVPITPPEPDDPIPRDAGGSRADVFRGIYADARWGDDGGEFFSGAGSRGDAAARYVETMTKQLESVHASLGRDVVVLDIGCGDFFIGSALVEACPFIRYVGCDIVPELIEHLQSQHGSERVRFETLDIVTADPPEGDVCLVRQVFQHLPNGDVQGALERLRGFGAIFLTESHPLVRHGPVNPDKPANEHARFDWLCGIGRGLEWGEAPFSLRAERIAETFGPPYEWIVTDRVWLDDGARAAPAREKKQKQEV